MQYGPVPLFLFLLSVVLVFMIMTIHSIQKLKHDQGSNFQPLIHHLFCDIYRELTIQKEKIFTEKSIGKDLKF